MTNNVDKILAMVCVMALIFSIVFFSFAGVEGKIESEILTTTREYTSGGVSYYIDAEELHDLISDDDITNDPFILSIRKAEHYALGHIPGAINIPLNKMFTEENLSKFPKDRQIVVYCYTGHTASQATALLNVNGYNAVSLKWGMCSWTSNDTVTVNKCYDISSAGHDYYSLCEGGIDPVVATASMSVAAAGMFGGFNSFCGGDTEPPETIVSGDIPSISEATSLREASHASLNQGIPAVIEAEKLYDLLYDSGESNDPFILSVRKPEHYTLGHICDAVNIEIENLFSDVGLEKLPDDKSKRIVVVCYTGHTASQTAALLNLNGYNATVLMWGMCSWTTNETVTANKCFNKTVDSNDYSFSSGSWNEDMRETIYNSLNMGKSPAIKASDLYEKLNDSDSSNDPFIVSIRKSQDYEQGHIPGAVNIPLSSLFTKENLSKLPFGKQIVMVCYTGHTASQATALLNAMGYNAIALKWGMCSWTTNTTINAGKCYELHASDYPIVTSEEPGSWM